MKKIALILLALCMTGAVLYAGGGQQGGTASGGTSGLTTIKAWGLDKTYGLDKGTISFSEWTKGSVPSRLFEKFTGDLAKAGVRVEYELVMYEQIGTAFQTLMASGQLQNYDWIAPVGPDIKTRYNLVNQKALYPLNQAIQQYSTGPARDYYFNSTPGKKLNKLNTLADGNFYWLTQNYNVYSGTPDKTGVEPLASSIRKDWLDKLGLPVPKTLDEFYNTLLAFQERDANGNGLKDEVADIATDGIGLGIPSWFGLVSSSIVWPLDGKAVSPWYQAHIKDYFTYMNKLYKAKLLNISDKGGITGNVANVTVENRNSFYAAYMFDTWTPPTVITPPGAPTAYYLPIVLQAYSDTEPLIQNEGGVLQWNGSGMYAVPAKSKNIEAVVKMIDYFYTQEYWDLNEYGIEGYTYSIDANKEISRFKPDSSGVGVDQQLMFQALVGLWSGWQGLFPRIRQYDNSIGRQKMMIETGQAMGYPNGYIEAYEVQAKAFAGTWKAMPSSEDAVLAFATLEESNRMNEILPDLNTYASELITALIIGEKSLNNWDSYIADLKRLGLDEMIRIYQARLDRAK
jgi:hypothetical protein